MLLLDIAALALVGQAAAQLTGRGFPDCNNGPLKNNTVCNKSAGMASSTHLADNVLC